MAINSKQRGEKMSTIKTEFYRYGNTIVASYRKAGRLGAYSLPPSAQQFEPGLQILAMIDFDRNGLAEKITCQGFIQIARERGIKELPLEIMPAKKAVDNKKRTAKKSAT
jgi:hypothetical protein